MLVGDVNSLSRVFDFLEHWGLINHPVSLEPAAIASEAPSPSVIGSYPSEVHVVSMPAVIAPKVSGISTFESSGRSQLCAYASPLTDHVLSREHTLGVT